MIIMSFFFLPALSPLSFSFAPLFSSAIHHSQSSGVIINPGAAGLNPDLRRGFREAGVIASGAPEAAGSLHSESAPERAPFASGVPSAAERAVSGIGACPAAAIERYSRALEALAELRHGILQELRRILPLGNYSNFGMSSVFHFKVNVKSAHALGRKMDISIREVPRDHG